MHMAECAPELLDLYATATRATPHAGTAKAGGRAGARGRGAAGAVPNAPHATPLQQQAGPAPTPAPLSAPAGAAAATPSPQPHQASGSAASLPPPRTAYAPSPPTPLPGVLLPGSAAAGLQPSPWSGGRATPGQVYGSQGAAAALACAGAHVCVTDGPGPTEGAAALGTTSRGCCSAVRANCVCVWGLPRHGGFF